MNKTISANNKKNAGETDFVFDYSPALESTDMVKINKQNKLFINGKWTSGKSGKFFDTINPANGEKLAELTEANAEDVDRAVKAARKAFEGSWSKLAPKQRGRYLFRIARIIQERSREIAVLETMDNGKPIKESRDFDIPQVAAHFFYYAGWADKLEYLFNGRNVSPIGVAGQIIPWNFPLLMAAWKIAPALAAGNCVVLKPAETTSLTALLLGEIIEEAGVPPGVVNIITGAGATGAALVNHPDVNKIAFTGSTEVGKIIARSTVNTAKKLTLELGGKSAHIVYEDAALDQAVESVVNGIYFNQGHVCCAGSRLLVEESIADIFVTKLKRRMTSLRVGDPLDKNTDVGAINSAGELKKIKGLIANAIEDGIEYYEPEATTLPQKGYYLKPCFFNNVAASATICRREIFGPVLAIQTFRTPEEAIQKANDTTYGLAAGIWSEKGSKIHKTAQALKAGVIWANTYNKFDPSSPFGGYNESGWGREGGRHGLLPYVEVK
ncbi:MAG: aldehyde dehydrogenase family protein [Deferribacteres bacterium]|nr:aldehyde dehydrogenase family protein [candidate division KSB1 bacterium]MCB9502792.1 aldehyde dehydrogenase family protein [Deferribacteres bacterium]